MTFSEFPLDDLILKALARIKYEQPSAIQAQTIPLILKHHDVIALAHTGSGKTAACAIPICQLVDTEKTSVQALIIVPTRELALQYATEAQRIGLEKGVKAFAIFGGESPVLQQSKLKHGVQVLVATPGRLIDFIYSRDIDLTQVKTLVLDEADEMLSMGFSEDLHFIMQCLNHKHQTLLFSATMPPQIRQIAKTQMVDPVEITLLQTDKTPAQIDHRFLYCRHDERTAALADQLMNLKPEQSIIFCHSRIEVDRVCRALQKQIDGVDFLHAGLSQDVRMIVTNKFRSARVKHLVATDVVSRGLDFSGVTHVFIYHLGDDPHIYVHRSGRTGRYGKRGQVVTLVTERELGALNGVLKTIGREAEWIGPPPPASSQRRQPPNRRRPAQPASTERSPRRPQSRKSSPTPGNRGQEREQ